MSDTKVYPWTHRALEVGAMALYLAIVVFVVLRAVWSPWTGDPVGVLWAMSALFVGLVCADFVSGFVHWLADSFCSVDMPIVGPAYLRPFREHHVYPEEIAQHDFIEVNGNNCVVILLFLPFVLNVQQLVSPMASAWLELWTVSFTIAIFLTNQAHSWAHSKEVPGWVAWLQQKRIFLNKDDHARHHKEPFDQYFCITFGWLNPILYRMRFFPVMTVVFSKFMPPADELPLEYDRYGARETSPGAE